MRAKGEVCSDIVKLRSWLVVTGDDIGTTGLKETKSKKSRTSTVGEYEAQRQRQNRQDEGLIVSEQTRCDSPKRLEIILVNECTGEFVEELSEQAGTSKRNATPHTKSA